jgi:hypothetical protein
MQKHVLLVLSNASGGRDDEFNQWYSNRHIPDVLKVPGFKAAQRFRLADAQLRGKKSEWRYLAVYEIETDDLKKTLDTLGSRLGTDAMVISDTLDMKSLGAFAFTPITERATSK